MSLYKFMAKNGKNVRVAGDVGKRSDGSSTTPPLSSQSTVKLNGYVPDSGDQLVKLNNNVTEGEQAAARRPRPYMSAGDV